MNRYERSIVNTEDENYEECALCEQNRHYGDCGCDCARCAVIDAEAMFDD